MSTRCNIILKDGEEEMFFYRHSDGYPEGAMPLLKKFLALVKAGVIRDNIGQSAGWLIILGAIEYQTIGPDLFPEFGKPSYERDDKKVNKVLKEFTPKDWKAGAIEPTDGIHGDVQYVYTINLKTKKITKRTA